MDSVLCVEFDNRRLISGSMDRAVRIWDIRSGRSIHKLLGHKVILTIPIRDMTFNICGDGTGRNNRKFQNFS